MSRYDQISQAHGEAWRDRQQFRRAAMDLAGKLISHFHTYIGGPDESVERVKFANSEDIEDAEQVPFGWFMDKHGLHFAFRVRYGEPGAPHAWTNFSLCIAKQDGAFTVKVPGVDKAVGVDSSDPSTLDVWAEHIFQQTLASARALPKAFTG